MEKIQFSSKEKNKDYIGYIICSNNIITNIIRNYRKIFVNKSFRDKISNINQIFFYGEKVEKK